MKLIDFINSKILSDICVQIFYSLRYSTYEVNYTLDFIQDCMKMCCVQYYIKCGDSYIDTDNIKYIEYAIGKQVSKIYVKLVRKL